MTWVDMGASQVIVREGWAVSGSKRKSTSDDKSGDESGVCVSCIKGKRDLHQRHYFCHGTHLLEHLPTTE